MEELVGIRHRISGGEIKLRDVEGIGKGKWCTATHKHCYPRRKAGPLLPALFRQNYLSAMIRKPYLVLFKGAFLFHMRAVLSRHHRFDVCHRHCNS